MTGQKSTIRILGVLLALALANGTAYHALGQTPLPGPHALAVDTPSATAAREHLDLRTDSAGDTLHIPVGHSVVLRGASDMRRVYVGDPNVLQSFTSGPSEIVLTAKAAGISSLVVWDASGKTCLYTVKSDMDPDDLQQALDKAYPTGQFKVEGRQGRIYLGGNVASQEISDGAVKLASTYAKDVISSLQIVPVHFKQVQLKLRIVEVDRTRLEQYGINFFAGGKVPLSVSTQQFASTNTIAPATATSPTTLTTSDPLNLSLFSQALQVGATVKDLEQKQILQILAEPTLTAISGQSAKFLSGGEFPFPVVQGGTANSTAITIMFRPYGVKVDFTPTVNQDGSIHLKVAPEVSTLDYTNAVTISGFTIPALSTRRAETEVEILSGQSFALSGLLDHRTTESISQLPGMSSIPLLGQLFRSKAYNHSVVELVVMVTATVVDPLNDPAKAVEPVFPVPNLDNDTFDHQLGKEQKIPGKR